MSKATPSLKSFFSPKQVNDIFVDITKKRHPSGDENEVRQYVANFIADLKSKGMDIEIVHYNPTATEPGDRVIVARKAAAKGKEGKTKLILQAHMDMVCKPDKNIFPLSLFTLKDDDVVWLKACKDGNPENGTTLGADDGIGVATALAILADEDLQLGQIECLFTVQEETDMGGAEGFNKELLEGRTYINLDSEDKEIITYGSAGGLKSAFNFEPARKNVMDKDTVFLKLHIYGLLSGHSGVNINEGRANAIQLMTRTLFKLNSRTNAAGDGDTYYFNLVSFNSNDTDNAIPADAKVVIAISDSTKDSFTDSFNSFCQLLKKEYGYVETNFKYEVVAEDRHQSMLTPEATDNLIQFLITLPHGVLRMNTEKKGCAFVETSSNLAIIRTTNDLVTIICTHRSSSDSELYWVRDIHRAAAAPYGINVTNSGKYPAWTPDEGSVLLNLARDVYSKYYKGSYDSDVVHAGLECGWAVEKYKGSKPAMDCISIGPTVKDPHTPNERLDTASVLDFWNCLVEILKKLAE